VSQRLGGKLFHAMLKTFGFGSITGIELDNELPGDLKPWKSSRQWSKSLLATTAFGQGISATPLQMIAALAALANAFWMPPHRAYIAMLASTTVIVAGALAIAVGALESPEPITVALALIAITAVIALELVHVGRRLDVAAAPEDLEITATVIAFLSTIFVAIVFGAPTLDALRSAFGRALDHELQSIAYTTAALAVLASVLVVVAGAVKPLLPDTTPVGTRLARVVGFADPVPVAAASFRALERAATVASGLFALFEQRAGVWLALVLIVGVLFWAVR